MKRRTDVIALPWLVCLLGTGVASAMQLTPEPATGTAAVLDDRYPARTIRFPDKVTGLPDLVYSRLPGYRPIILDLYLPAAHAGRNAKSRPVIIYVHGGGGNSGHTRQAAAFENWPGVLASIAARGYVVASIEYRLGSEATSPAQIQDVKAAIQWLRSNAALYGIDKNRFGIWGGSAGGLLAALAGTSCGARELEPIGAGAESSCVQAVVAWYGTFDAQPLATIPELMAMLGCKLSPCEDERIKMASPVRYLDPTDPPFLLIHGANDSVAPLSQTLKFAEALKRNNVRGDLLVIPDVDHSFVGKTGAITHVASIQALNRTIAFFDETIGAQHK
jgi:acetyl esterase/lipase